MSIKPKSNGQIEGIKKFFFSISEMENQGNYILYSKPMFKKKFNIDALFFEDYCADLPVKYTARGLYYQKAPFEQALLISCRSGSVAVYLVDVRKDSPTYLKYNRYLLNAAKDGRDYLFIPRGVAYGFVSLKDNTELDIKSDNYSNPECTEVFNLADPYFSMPMLDPETDLNNQPLSTLISNNTLRISVKDKAAQWVHEYEDSELYEGNEILV